MPFFSVIIPSYNRANFIGQTIDSVLAQSFDDWELIIVDDGSTDNTEEVISKYGDERIHYFKKENGERGAARNYGASKASGTYLNFFDSDDLMKPIHLQSAYDYISQHNPDVVCFPWEYLSEDGKKVGRRDYSEDLNEVVYKKNFIHLNGGFIKKEVFLDSPFCEDRKFNICEDWYFYMNLALRNKLESVNTPTFDYILHSGSTMSNMSSASFLTAIEYFTALIAKHDKVRHHRKYIMSDLYGMLGLSYALERKRSKSFGMLWKVFITRPTAFFARRTLGTIKNLIYAPRRS